MAKKGKTAVHMNAFSPQIGPRAVGLELGQLPALAWLEQILEGEHHHCVSPRMLCGILWIDRWLQPTHHTQIGLQALQASTRRRIGWIKLALLLGCHDLAVDPG